ncbi:MAG: TIGR00266 family protein [Candidatus Epulonipiscioides saccharophilum]|nr:MAG: TIGR00266 family protein [Epulopiscium sp. AS2M-Bin001]
MNYKIFGDSFPAVTITLDKNEEVFTQSGGMIWLDEHIKMESNLKGGIGKSIGRMFAGESLFMVTYISKRDNSEITFGAKCPGTIIPVTLNRGYEIIAQKDAFLCAPPSVSLEVTFTKKLSSGFFGGEGFILQRIFGEGIVFLESAGSVITKTLQNGEVCLVDSGNVVAFEKTVSYEIETVKGVKNILFGGEGLFLTKLTGPGKIWLQTLTLQNMAANLIPFLPINDR